MAAAESPGPASSPLVSDHWQLSEPSAGTAGGAVLPEGSNSFLRGGDAAKGESPLNRGGFSRAMKFWDTAIYKFDAESPIGEH